MTNSEGSDFSHDEGRILYANSYGFVGEYVVSGILSRSRQWRPNRRPEHAAGLLVFGSTKAGGSEPAGLIGDGGPANPAPARGKKISTQQIPVIFDPEMSAGLLSSLFGSVSGSAIYKGASFLIGKLGHQIASPHVTVYDDGTIRGALVPSRSMRRVCRRGRRR
jgi:PmbA protein